MFEFMTSNPLKSFLYFLTVSYLSRYILPKSKWQALGSYGKLLESHKLPFPTVPKAYFRHFYRMAAFVYAPAALYQVLSVYVFNNDVSDVFKAVLEFFCGPDRQATVTATHALVALVLYSSQIYRRFYETHYIVVIGGKASVDLFSYILSLPYYMFALLLLLCEAPKFATTYDEHNIGIHLHALNWIDFVAIALFCWAWYAQHVTTVILANLRKDSKGKVTDENYKIPHGSLFEYLSSPHCNTEILMYIALTILLRANGAWFSVFWLVLSNQIGSIVASHEWYRKRFPDFPKKRKMLIPWIY